MDSMNLLTEFNRLFSFNRTSPSNPKEIETPKPDYITSKKVDRAQIFFPSSECSDGAIRAQHNDVKDSTFMDNPLNCKEIERMDRKAEIEITLQDWCNDVKEKEEFPARIEATDRILKFCQNRDKSLDLSGLGLTSLPQIFHLLPNKFNGIYGDPPTPLFISRLLVLNLANNQLSELPPLPKSLVSINISRNKFTVVPEQIQPLIDLKELVCSHNKLTSLPSWFDKLISLQKIDARLNELWKLPKLTKWVQELLLSCNKLEQLPALPEQLRILEIGHNEFKSFPNQIGKLKHLKKLDYSNNNLWNLPICLRDLNLLEDLYLSGNKIKKLPDEALPRLKVIDLSDNLIEAIPPSYDYLLGLLRFDLRNNNIKHISGILKNRPTIDEKRVVLLEGNPVCESIKSAKAEDAVAEVSGAAAAPDASAKSP